MANGYDWPTDAPAPEGQNAGQQNREVKVDLSVTDPDAIMRAIQPKMGALIAEAVRETVAAVQRDAGVDKIDRQYLRFPEVPQGGYGGGHGGNGQTGQRQGQYQYTPFDLVDKRGWDNPQIRSARLNLMGGWFRAIFSRQGPNAATLQHCIGCELPEQVIRVLSTETSEGGYLIPPGFVAEVVMDVPKLSQLFQYVRRIPVAGNTGFMPRVDTNCMVFWGQENEAIQEGDPSFTDTTYAIQRMNALVTLSREIANDSNPDIVQTVTELFQRCIAEERDRVIAVGSGSGQPMGLYSASGIYDTGITSLTYQNLVKLKNSIDIRYHGLRTFRWTFNQNVLAALMNIVDTLGRPILQEPTAGEPAKILNVPYSIERRFPDWYIGIGALEYYLWFDRQQVTVERTLEGGNAFVNHQMMIKFIERADAKPALPPTTPMARSTVLTGVTELGTGIIH